VNPRIALRAERVPQSAKGVTKACDARADLLARGSPSSELDVRSQIAQHFILGPPHFAFLIRLGVVVAQQVQHAMDDEQQQFVAHRMTS
jgi:hypothetical protein